LFQLSGKSRLLVRNTMPGGTVVIENTSHNGVLTDIGFSGSQVAYYAPKALVGLDGDIAVVVTTTNENEYYQKIKAGGVETTNDPLSTSLWFKIGSDEWKAATPTRSTGRNNPILSNLGSKLITFNVSANPSAAISFTTGAGINDIAGLVAGVKAHFDNLKALSAGDANYIASTDPRFETLHTLEFKANGAAFEVINRKG